MPEHQEFQTIAIGFKFFSNRRNTLKWWSNTCSWSLTESSSVYIGGKYIINIWNKQYTVEPEHETVPIPHGYRVVKEAEETFKFIPPDDYLDLALEAEAKGKRYIKHLGDNYSIVYVNEGPLEESRSMITANNYQNNNGSRFDLLSNSYTIYKSFWDHSYADEVRIDIFSLFYKNMYWGLYL